MIDYHKLPSLPGGPPARGSVRSTCAALLVASLAVPAALADQLAVVQPEPWPAAAVPAGPALEPEVASLGEDPQAQKFMFVAGSNFVPRNDGAYTYAGAGCIRSVGATDLFTIDLQLEDGVLIDFLRLYYYDTVAGQSLTAWLSEYNAQGGTTDIFSTASNTDTGYGSNGDFFAYTVNTSTRALSLQVRPSAVSANLRICGIRIRYQDAEIFIDGFETGDTSRWSSTQP